MKKKRFYTPGAVFEITRHSHVIVYILAQVDYNRFNLISLSDDANRNVQQTGKQKRHGVSDYILRKLIGGWSDSYTYLGQFPEVFERMG
ncbi:hypothetical protein LCGC14_2592530 [marine sediment metagenome]|uniref:Uncharacterized protein n=1 Tax=marine sediment metagenome TaxID=412755 RepID=A0A0F9AB81_9ZZZZ